MPGVTKDQIEQAKQVGIVEYLQRCEPDNLIRQGPNRYVLRDHDSFVISNGKWCWNSRRYGCETGTALNYLTDVRKIGFVDAVRLLCGNAIVSKISQANRNTKSPPNTEFQLPPRNRDNNRVTAYLQSRGIAPAVIEDCIQNGNLYESAQHHNCVFTGRDENGKVRFGCMRGIGNQFRRDLRGSDKRYGFVIPPSESFWQNNLAVFEAPIDVLSHKTLCREGFIEWDGWRLALGGSTLAHLETFLDSHKQVAGCLICTDNDAAGLEIFENIKVLLSRKEELCAISLIPSFPPTGKDYNDTLLATQKNERERSKSHRHLNEIEI